MCAIHWSRRWTFKVDPFAVITAAVTRTLELVLTRFPVGRAPQMRAAGVNHKHTVRRLIHPDAVLLLPLGIHAQGIIAEKSNFESAGRFGNRTRQEKPHEHQKASRHKTGDACPHDAA